ncbi:IS66-like element accessory protein TnpA [Mesorhizobium sp. CA12]|uniref:IS66-like element accessory protein TnpA n=1 Tax=Mesorhizobium sp. CA12 TaxID=2876644 RepID=UPI001CCFDCA2|nr:transposase [Mesorhizobium sp. CA12]MBZ9859086.1 transposase [Mesorhizobium sp. CA12]
MSGLDLTLDPERQLRRFEVINGAGGRRHWSMDDKARIVAETLEPNAIISEVARRYGLRPQQVFAWRREARKQAAWVQQESPAFVPAVVTAPPPGSAPTRPAQPQKRKTARDAGVIELEIDGIAMRVGRGADAKTVAAVIRALKATS